MITSSKTERLLNCDAVHVRPLDIDWREALGDNCEGWRSYEASTCPECSKLVVVSMHGECECREALPEVEVESLPEAKCRYCLGTGTIGDDLGCGECEGTGDNYETEPREIETRANACTATLYNEGPVMSYWYPVRIDDCEEAAKKIAHLPLCVVEFEDGRTGLALTGGGMDLSWEVCEAFIALGYWPPVHFCDLPRMADRGESAHDRSVIEACAESCRIAEGWVARTRARLTENFPEVALPEGTLAPL
jgi:hypothetical protein